MCVLKANSIHYTNAGVLSYLTPKKRKNMNVLAWGIPAAYEKGMETHTNLFLSYTEFVFPKRKLLRTEGSIEDLALVHASERPPIRVFYVNACRPFKRNEENELWNMFKYQLFSDVTVLCTTYMAVAGNNFMAKDLIRTGTHWNEMIRMRVTEMANIFGYIVQKTKSVMEGDMYTNAFVIVPCNDENVIAQQATWNENSGLLQLTYVDLPRDLKRIKH